MASSSGGGRGVEGGVPEGPTTLDELYQINVVPAELHFKFRKELQGLRVGLNFEVSSLPLLNPKTYHKPRVRTVGYELRSLVDLIVSYPDGEMSFTTPAYSSRSCCPFCSWDETSA
jgi:hypothetical protein